MFTINKSHIQRYRQLSGKRDTATIDMYIGDSKFVDMQGLLGVKLFEDLDNNTTNHTDLIQGSTYTYDGVTYTNVGLEIVWSHFAYARYIMFGGFTDTPYNFVEKTNPDSTPVSEKSKAIIYKSNQQIAYTYWDNVRSFLDRTDYTLWDNLCDRETVSNFRINSIGR